MDDIARNLCSSAVKRDLMSLQIENCAAFEIYIYIFFNDITWASIMGPTYSSMWSCCGVGKTSPNSKAL